MQVVNGRFQGLLLHTTNAGASWSEHSVPGQFCTSLSFVSRGVGFATALNEFGTSGVMAFR